MADLLDDAAIEEKLGGLDGWSRDGDAIVKKFDHGDFVGSVEFVRRLTQPAEEMGHHPDLKISWSEVEVSITNHAAGGLTDTDFELAAKIDGLEGSHVTVDREDVRFRSGEDDCAAWLYRPAPVNGTGSACVVLAHGFGGTKEARLDAFAERFAAAGHAALVFDYRYHGDSGGEPRLLIDIGRQRDDWRAALAYARQLDGVDASRIVAWGTSFSGGHVLELAAAGEPVAAVIAQGPFMSGPAVLGSAGLGHNNRLALAGLRDVIASWRGGSHSIAVVGPPGSTAAMTSPDAMPGYLALIPPGYDWPNRFLPRGTLSLPIQRPYSKAKRVTVPMLVQVMSDDVVTPPEPARRAAQAAPRGELIEYPGGHFDIYVGEPFERAVADQIAFLERVL